MVADGDPVLKEEFFKQEYITNSTIGKFRLHTTASRHAVLRSLLTARSLLGAAGTYRKPYVALMDGITMGGVSVAVLIKVLH